MVRSVRLLLALALLLAVAPSAAARPYGGACLPGSPERCERWAVEVSAPAPEGKRSDQFVTGLATGGGTAFLTMKDQQGDPGDAYASTAQGALVALDVATGAERWRSAVATRAYDTLLDVDATRDGRTVVVTGAAYDGFVVGAKDSRVVTAAFDGATGRQLWLSTWDGRPDGTDNGKVVALSPDGRRAYVGGVTTVAPGDLDYVVVAYDTATGRERWARTYAGLGAGGDDALYDLAVSPDGDRVLVTGDSAATREFDVDMATVALDARNGRVAWEHRLDGLGAQVSDRARALAVDGRHVYVTGDSSPADRSADLDVLTAAIDLRSGTTAWTRRQDPSGGRFDTGRAIALAGDRVVVTTQTPGLEADSGLDQTTAALDVATGAVAWEARNGATRTSELANAAVATAGGELVTVAANARPVVDKTALNSMLLTTYRVADGTVAWRTRLEAEAGNAVTATQLAASADGASVVTAGQLTRSANPLEPPSQDVYDVVAAGFAAR